MLRRRALSAFTRVFNAPWRAVSKHEGGSAAPSFETGAARPPQDEAAQRIPNSRLVAEPFSVISISRCQTAHLVPAARLRPGFATLLHSPRTEGWAERRQTFGC